MTCHERISLALLLGLYGRSTLHIRDAALQATDGDILLRCLLPLLYLRPHQGLVVGKRVVDGVSSEKVQIGTDRRAVQRVSSRICRQLCGALPV